MKKHFVNFYGSIKIITGHNSMTKESIANRNTVVGFENKTLNSELIEFGEKCFSEINKDGIIGKVETLLSENTTIIPFRYFFKEELIIKQLESVIDANELKVKADSIGFPLIQLKNVTNSEFRDYLKYNHDSSGKINEFKQKHCCYGHYYLKLLKTALKNKGYSSENLKGNSNFQNLINTTFKKTDGTRVQIHADAGM